MVLDAIIGISVKGQLAACKQHCLVVLKVLEFSEVFGEQFEQDGELGEFSGAGESVRQLQAESLDGGDVMGDADAFLGDVESHEVKYTILQNLSHIR